VVDGSVLGKRKSEMNGVGGSNQGRREEKYERLSSIVIDAFGGRKRGKRGN